MQTMIAATLLAVLAVAALGLGLVFGRPALRGSCGGIVCGGACHACPNREEDRA
ncbi:hypothetical protein [Arsenicitalea aurantiaca]|jgi:hypothetical protein|uniref:hypothetical protein n=1 Tax=Arsenicitalea aurantiaca TaxID=1783274 RepID=UPI001864B509|nr:hypothetical protein [Arsenicitalea aurantiaca]